MWIGPPKALDWPNPMSSISTMSTLGAPAGAFTSNRGGAFAFRTSSSVIGGGCGLRDRQDRAIERCRRRPARRPPPGHDRPRAGIRPATRSPPSDRAGRRGTTTAIGRRLARLSSNRPASPGRGFGIGRDTATLNRTYCNATPEPLHAPDGGEDRISPDGSTDIARSDLYGERLAGTINQSPRRGGVLSDHARGSCEVDSRVLSSTRRRG